MTYGGRHVTCKVRRVPEPCPDLLRTEGMPLGNGLRALPLGEGPHDGGDITRVPVMKGLPNRMSGSTEMPGKIHGNQPASRPSPSVG